MTEGQKVGGKAVVTLTAKQNNFCTARSGNRIDVAEESKRREKMHLTLESKKMDMKAKPVKRRASSLAVMARHATAVLGTNLGAVQHAVLVQGVWTKQQFASLAVKLLWWVGNDEITRRSGFI